MSDPQTTHDNSIIIAHTHLNGNGVEDAHPRVTEWNDVLSIEYAKFSGTIPTDKVGYLVIQENFIEEGDRVVDIGSNVGNFSRTIATKASYVLALEPSHAAIEEGIRRNSEEGVENVIFTQIPQLGTYDIEDAGSYDKVVMCFVDPVMTTEQLDNAITESSKLLRVGGKLIIYSLNPENILSGPESAHHYYTERITNGGLINEGATMTHTLNLPNGEALTLTDVVHLNTHISNTGIKNGFGKAIVRVLSRNMPNGLGHTVQRGIELVEQEIGKPVLDEFGDITTIPLYRLIVMEKLDPSIFNEG